MLFATGSTHAETIVLRREDIATPFVGELDMEVGVQEVRRYHRGTIRVIELFHITMVSVFLRV